MRPAAYSLKHQQLSGLKSLLPVNRAARPSLTAGRGSLQICCAVLIDAGITATLRFCARPFPCSSQYIFTTVEKSVQAKPETVDKVCKIVKKQLALPDDSSLTGESKFASLGADSLDTVEIVMGLEEEFGISVEEDTAQSIATVQDAADMIEMLLEKKGA
ncbi:hypothetical protein MLD38_036124 [Melastoma candidum]|uniref:Uncharacterized protein n=1 Tax=Melastoma candidum TaxID=119954 RepID=A0ACB9LJN1_9MYRT|nr:hypothetical protein MLD38_036124 [Melastoma candidum]